MKSTLFILLNFLAIFCYGQQTINGSITHNGLQRTYILYVPASYSVSTNTPLVFNFHGYTSNANEQMQYGDFRSIADTAGFLVVHPMGTLDSQGQTFWNAGFGAAVDDIGFTDALIDSLAKDYSIDLNRVYSTGMSNGGIMSYTLACKLSNRFAAIASVTGTMNLNQSQTCTPQHPTPVMEIHGTADPTVPYNGTAGSMESIKNVLNYWINFNHCDTAAIINNVPNTATTDGSTAIHYIYNNGNNGATVEHYKIVGGEHTWPGAPVVIGVTNYDINASVKIWQFFAQYDIHGKISLSTSIEPQLKEKNDIKISSFPNPAKNSITINWDQSNTKFIQIINALGMEISRFPTLNKQQITLPIYNWSAGIYFIKLYNNNGSLTTNKFLIAD